MARDKLTGTGASRTEIWEAAKSAVRDEVRKHRPSQHFWTNISPDAMGASADSWVLWSAGMVDSFNQKRVKLAISIPKVKRRPFRKKPLIEFAQALRDA